MRFYEIAEAVVNPKKAAEYTKSIDMPKALAIAQTHCSDALNTYLQTGKSLFKGFSVRGVTGERFDKNFYAIDSSQIMRISQNTANFYTEFTSNYSQKWKQLPPRNASLICSSTTRYAGGYGTLFCVFPENGTDIGVCPSFDFWESFQKSGIDSMGEFSDDMISVYKGSKLDWQTFLSTPLRKFTYKNFSGKRPLTHLVYFQKFTPDTLMGEALEQLMDPELNHFLKMKPNQIKSIPSDRNGRECWFSGRCVIANKSALDALIKKGIVK